MSDCCVPPGCEIFGERTARRDARRYRKKGLEKTARRLVDYLVSRGVHDASVLEVGGGVGAIELELLDAGAERATNVEMSPAYEPFARELAEERGLAGRVARHVLDFARGADDVKPADIVVMHKVVCCYPDMEGLVRPAARRARRYLALTYPQDRWYVRGGVGFVNLVMRLLRREFRTFVHPPVSIVAAASEEGLRPVFRHDGHLWQQTALERAG